MPREFSRRMRLGAELQRLLNELLLTEVKDPRLTGVSVSEVDVSGDLGVARIYFTTLDPDAGSEAAAEGLARASGFMRGRIGKVLRVRRVPELRFIHDDSARRGVELTRLIEQVAPDDDREER
jgi:ribosome-binding factor A